MSAKDVNLLAYVLDSKARMRRLSLAWLIACISAFAAQLFCPIGFCCIGKPGVAPMSLCALINAQGPNALAKWPFTDINSFPQPGQCDFCFALMVSIIFSWTRRTRCILCSDVYGFQRLRCYKWHLLCGSRCAGFDIAVVFDSVRPLNADTIRFKLNLHVTLLRRPCIPEIWNGACVEHFGQIDSKPASICTRTYYEPFEAKNGKKWPTIAGKVKEKHGSVFSV